MITAYDVRKRMDDARDEYLKYESFCAERANALQVWLSWNKVWNAVQAGVDPTIAVLMR